MNSNFPQHSHRLALVIALLVTVVLFACATMFGSVVYQDYTEAKLGRSAVVTDQAKENSLLDLRDLAKRASASKEALTGFIITEDSLFKFADLLEEVGAHKGATTSVVSPSELGFTDPKTKKDVLAGWRLELRLEGSFNQVWQGIKLIEALPVAKRITKVTMVRTSTPQTAGVVRWGGGVVIELPTIR